MPFVDPPVRLVVAGDGTQRTALEKSVEELSVTDRVEFRGTVSDDKLVELYAGALGVAYAPFDEDYGYVTLEAFLARRPVVTADDSGGTLEFVVDGTNGFVCAPNPEAVADRFNRIAADRRLASSLGSAGFERARQITWDGVIEKLVGAAS